MSESCLFKNLQLLDPRWTEPRPGYEVRTADGFVAKVADQPIKAPRATVVDWAGHALMPGLFDGHAHVCLSEVNVRRMEETSLTLMTAHAAKSMLSHAELWIYHGTRSGQCRLGHQTGSDCRSDPGLSPLHRRPGHWAYRWS